MSAPSIKLVVSFPSGTREIDIPVEVVSSLQMLVQRSLKSRQSRETTNKFSREEDRRFGVLDKALDEALLVWEAGWGDYHFDFESGHFEEN